jgi:hypothetical protein
LVRIYSCHRRKKQRRNILIHCMAGIDLVYVHFATGAGPVLTTHIFIANTIVIPPSHQRMQEGIVSLLARVRRSKVCDLAADDERQGGAVASPPCGKVARRGATAKIGCIMWLPKPHSSAVTQSQDPANLPLAKASESLALAPFPPSAFSLS